MKQHCRLCAPFVAGSLSADAAHQFEEHLLQCDSCQTKLDALAIELAREQNHALRSNNECLILPSELSRRLHVLLSTEADHAQQLEVHAHSSSVRVAAPIGSHGIRRLSAVVLISAAAIYGLLFGIRVFWPRDPIIESHHSGVIRTEAVTQSKQEQPTPSQLPAFQPALIAREGYLAIEQPTEDDEIPFYWVLRESALSIAN